MIQIYTGNGKGKTTLAVGLAFRALGHEKQVLLIQFMKKNKDLGELKAAQRFRKFKILQTGCPAWVDKKKVSVKDKQCARKGLSFAQKAIESKNYDLIILDELNVAVDFGLLKVQEVKRILKDCPSCQEIVITGRNAHPQILTLADLVSEIREIKHYYTSGITARAGIEY